MIFTITTLNIIGITDYNETQEIFSIHQNTPTVVCALQLSKQISNIYDRILGALAI